VNSPRCFSRAALLLSLHADRNREGDKLVRAGIQGLLAYKARIAGIEVWAAVAQVLVSPSMPARLV
jgi:hypothetical protein